jgi:hypothetical protein
MVESASCDSLASLLTSNDLEQYKSYAQTAEINSDYGCYCRGENQSKGACKCFASQSKIIARLQYDLRTAAEVGTALVERHQQLIESSDREKTAMQKEIDLLIEGLDDVRTKNDGLLQENSDLIEELQILNSGMQESDERIDSLTEALSFAKERIMRLNGFQLHSRGLESQLAAVEAAREALSEELSIAHKDKRVAETRWRKTENVLENLVSQYEHLEGRSDHSSEDTLLSTSPSMQGFFRSVLQDNSRLESLTQDLKRQLAENRRELEVLKFNSITGHGYHVESSSPLRKERLPLTPILANSVVPNWDSEQKGAVAYLTPPSTATKSRMSISTTFSSPRHRSRRSSTNSHDVDSILGHRKRNSLLINSPISPTHSRQSSLTASPSLRGVQYEDKLDYDLTRVTISPSPQLRRVGSHESVLSSRFESSFAPTWNAPFQIPQLAQPTISFEPTFAAPMTSSGRATSSTKLLLSAAVANSVQKEKSVTRKPSIQSESSGTTAKRSWATYLLPFKGAAEDI